MWTLHVSRFTDKSDYLNVVDCLAIVTSGRIGPLLLSCYLKDVDIRTETVDFSLTECFLDTPSLTLMSNKSILHD